MKVAEQETFALDNFEGPIDFLLHLVQKKEIDIYEVALQQITEQYLERQKKSVDIEKGAEFIGITSLLLWLKSKTLLPKHEQEGQQGEDRLDPRFEIIHQLLDYCRFKDVAKEFVQRDVSQHAYYTRAGESIGTMQQRLGVEHLSLYDLAALFQDAVARVEASSETINEEMWRTSDKIQEIRLELKKGSSFSIEKLFGTGKSREELIVTFLAILELMKLGELDVVRMEKQVKLTRFATYQKRRDYDERD